MSNTRRNPTQNECAILLAQVDQLCPKCKRPLMYQKAGRTNKNYQVAHIYPLNPTAEEARLLKDEERLSEDVNHIDNFIALCGGCHTEFDKPRTVDDYKHLVSIKKEAITRHRARLKYHDSAITEHLRSIIDSLTTGFHEEASTALSYDAKTIDEKIGETVAPLTKRKLTHHVVDYFYLIRQQLISLEQEEPGAAELLSQQIKTFYVTIRQEGISDEMIIEHIVEWITAKLNDVPADAAEIIVSFFIQNCEVF